MLAFEVPRQVAFSGAVTGVSYGVMAVGLILVFRSNRVVNFAIAEMGGFSAALMARLVLDWDVPYWLSFAVCLLVGALVGGAIELFVVRRLFTAPRVILLVATIGVAQLLLFAQASLPDPENALAYPTPFSRTWEIGGVLVRSEHLMVLIVVPLAALALGLFLSRTRYGLAIRASAANPDAARLASISIKRMSTLVWVLAGALAAVATIVSAPLTTTSAAQIFTIGPTLLLRALTAALLARMSSLPVALAAGVAIGISESVLTYNDDQRGLLDAALFVVVLVALLGLARSREAADSSGAWSLSPRIRPVPAALDGVFWVRRLPQLGSLLLVLVALFPVVLLNQPSQQFLWTRVVLYAMVAVSLTVLTGWAGQLSLGQFAFVGLGAMTTTALVREGIGFVPAVALASLVGAGAAVVIGAPALRRPGLFLAVSTLAFAVMTSSWLLFRSVFVPDGAVPVRLPRQIIGTVSLASQATYYLVCLGVLVVILAGVSSLRRSSLGRSMIAVRDNERAAASFGISPARIKLTAFGIGGAIAGLAGGLLGGLLITFEPARFSATESLRVISIAVIGGLTSVAGTVLGAVWVVGLPALFDDSVEIGLLTSGAGLLILLLYFPGGLVQVLYTARDIVLARIAARRTAGDGVGAPKAAAVPVPVPRTRATVPAGLDVLLRARGLTVRFAGRVVLDQVDLEVRPGEVVGLIGSNGAGKSTLMNAVGGFVASSGGIEILGRDVHRMAPARRARLGLGRSFQGAELFPDLTVRETVVLAAPGRGAVARSQADEIITFLGLGRFVDRFVSELSTGTRRIVELACLVVSGARMLCLDEPTAGIAQRESEAFGPLIVRIREELDASLLVIEHDMPVVMGISDRVYCLEAGRLISEGPPDRVRHDPNVIASYLGTDPDAIQRSGARTATT
jgi:ABC-type branched-subunit amino acid transport system ATPase component/ABC-type branched-subunit amino acid transport system permease subunit